MQNNSQENLREDEQLDTSPENLNLLASIQNFLSDCNFNQKLQRMDSQVADVMNLEECQSYLDYKQQCLNQLQKFSPDPTAFALLNTAIEQGFIVGYWMALQHELPQTAN